MMTMPTGFDINQARAMVEEMEGYLLIADRIDTGAYVPEKLEMTLLYAKMKRICIKLWHIIDEGLIQQEVTDREKAAFILERLERAGLFVAPKEDYEELVTRMKRQGDEIEALEARTKSLLEN